jgi:hypothetical protein
VGEAVGVSEGLGVEVFVMVGVMVADGDGVADGVADGDGVSVEVWVGERGAGSVVAASITTSMEAGLLTEPHPVSNRSRLSRMMKTTLKRINSATPPIR